MADWHRAIDGKVKTLDDLYQLLNNDQTNRRMLILEAMIVLLFVIDLIVLAMGMDCDCAIYDCAFAPGSNPAYSGQVKLSVKSHYAARAVLGLAQHYPDGQAVRVEDLAREQGVPPNYLVQILIELKSAGIVRSIRGKEGGYLLARAPAEITLADLLIAVHGSVFASAALDDPSCPDELRKAWETLQRAVEGAAQSVNFQQLVDEAGDKEKMYYI